MPPPVKKVLAGVIAAVLVLGLLAAVVPGVVHARQDLAGIRRDADGQLAAVRVQVRLARQQLATVRRQLDVAEQQKTISADTLEVARRQLDLAEQLLALIKLQLGKSDQLLDIARRTLAQVEEINRKTPNLSPCVAPSPPSPPSPC